MRKMKRKFYKPAVKKQVQSTQSSDDKEQTEEEEKLFSVSEKKILKLQGGYVDCGQFPFWKSGQKGLTVCCWVKPNVKTDYIVVSQGGGWSDKGWQIFRFQGQIRIELQDNKDKKLYDNSEDLKEKEWQHVGFTYNNVSMYTYLNGKKLQNTCQLLNPSFPDKVPNLQFGRNFNNGYVLDGSLSNVKIFDYALSDEEMKKEMFKNYSKDEVPSTLIGYWPLESNLLNIGQRSGGDGEVKGSKFSNDFKVANDFPKAFKPFTVDHFNEEKANKLLTKLYDGLFSDFKIKGEKSEGETVEFKVHKNVLGAESNEFKKVILDNAQSGEYTIKGFDLEVIEQGLNYIYLGQCEITADNFNDIIKFSEKFGLHKLRQKAFLYMVKSLNETTVMPVLFKAKNKEFEFDSGDLVIQCLKVLEKKIEKVFDSSYLYQMDEQLLTELLKSSGLNIDELDLYRYIIKWGENVKKSNPNEKREVKEIIKSLMELVRFPLFTVDELLEAKKDGYISEDSYLLAVENAVNPKAFLKDPRPLFTNRAKVFKKSILLTTAYCQLLIKWLKLDSTCKGFQKVYQASVDGWSTGNFHSNCDGKGPSVVVIKSSNGNIFGGWAPNGWNGVSGYDYTASSFIFSLKNALNKPLKMDFKSGTSGSYSYSSYGPTFGGGHDIYICNSPNTVQSSYTNLGHSYTHPDPNYYYGSQQAKDFLAGSYNFLVSEIEVFVLIK